nr:hypothetical protein [Nanoarchaeota archaeon]
MGSENENNNNRGLKIVVAFLALLATSSWVFTGNTILSNNQNQQIIMTDVQAQLDDCKDYNRDLQEQVNTLQSSMSNCEAQKMDMIEENNALELDILAKQSVISNYANFKCCNGWFGWGNKKYYYITENDVQCIEEVDLKDGLTGC